jgi:hypothetical protein
VGGRLLSIEQAGLGEQERARADRGDPARAPGGGADPVDQRLVVDGGVGAEATGDDEGVDRAAAAREIAVGLDLEPARGAERA